MTGPPPPASAIPHHQLLWGQVLESSLLPLCFPGPHCAVPCCAQLLSWKMASFKWLKHLVQEHLGTSRLQSPAAEGHDGNLCGGSVTWLLGTSMPRRSRGFGFKQGDLGEGLHTNSMIILDRLFFSRRREGPMAQGCTQCTMVFQSMKSHV